MLNFARNIDTETLLLNTTELTKFTPNKSTNNALQIVKGHKIQVITKETHLNKDYDNSELVLVHQRHYSYTQEKMILIWHFSLLMPYLEKRLGELIAMPIDTLHQYHDNSMQLQGFYQLCHNLSSQLAMLNQSIAQLENPQKQYWTIDFKLLQVYLSDDLQQIVMAAQKGIAQIIEQRKMKLTHEIPEIKFRIAHNSIEFEQVMRPMPLKYSLGVVNVGLQQYEVRAHLQTYSMTWSTPTKFQFTGKLNVSVFDDEQSLHPALLVYPSWDSAPLVEMTQPNLNTAHDFAHNKLLKQYTEQHIGNIFIEPVTLRANFVTLCNHVTSNDMSPFFVALVGIATSNHIKQITLYAPYNYSNIMYAHGFYSLDSDVLLPTKKQQEHKVEKAFAAGTKTPKNHKRFKRKDADDEPLLRPFCFHLDELKSRPVILTESKVKTTYAQLLSESTMDLEKKDTGILPEILQIPLKFTGNLFTLTKQRETTGKLKRPAVAFAVEEVDYGTLSKDNNLQNYAFSDPVASEQSQYQKMLVLKRIIRQ